MNELESTITKVTIDTSKGCLQLSDDATENEVQQISEHMGGYTSYGLILYGDLYNEARRIGVVQHGKDSMWLKKFANDSGYQAKAIRNAGSVMYKFNLSRRRDKLQYSHYAELASLPDNKIDEMIDKCVEEGWTQKQTRKKVREVIGAKQKEIPNGHLQNAQIVHGDAENLPIEDESIDVIITSPPYNLGEEAWPMGGEGRTERETGIGYADDKSEDEYQQWQVSCLIEWFRVAKPGASLFYNHKVRQRYGSIIHPLDWLRSNDNPWTIRQEIIWDRLSTHNHTKSLFWPHDERIYWMTKGKPILPERSIGDSTIWRFHGPAPNTWHPAPFSEELPKRCLQAIGRDGIIVLDPFGGSMTTCRVAESFGYRSIGVDINKEYVEAYSND